MAHRPKDIHIFGTLAAAVAFAAVLVTFAIQTISFGSDVEARARADLRTQAFLTADSLASALERQDFKKLREFASSLEEKGLSLRVNSSRGGIIYAGDNDAKALVEFARAGEYKVGVALSRKKALLPFYEALGIFALASLVGVLGMFVVFFSLYRQRVRIRELAQSERFRREFMADISHEIKTPLAGILGAAEMLSENCVQENEKGTCGTLAAMIAKESKRLDSLVQRILDLSKLEHSREAFTPSVVDVADIVKDAVFTITPVAVAKGVRISLSLPEGAAMANCDAALLREAILNLITNAIRHSGEKEVFVSLEAIGKKAQVIVEDHGCGIAKEHRARIFERFYRVDSSRASETGGAGLGLSIVKRIATLHGGEISFKPLEERGSRFELSIPLVVNL
jgi:signal transduction histidine kinase